MLNDLFRPPSAPRRGGPEQAFQMLWDCRFCGTTKLLGVDHRHCPNCGAAQDPEWRYFPSDEDKVVVSDPNYKYAGVDKICPFCQQPNSAAANFCVQCGGDLTNAKAAALRSEVAAGSATDTGKRADVVMEKFQAQMGAITGKGAQGITVNKNVVRVLIGVGVAIAVIIIGLIILSRSTYAASMQVTNLTWERVIHVERLNAVGGSGWRDQVPGDAYNMACHSEQRPYQVSERYQCGTTRQDRGDGSFVEAPKYCTRTRTEYKTDSKCNYTVNRWQGINDLTARGGPNDALQWPAFNPSGGGGVGSTREASREEWLKVFLKGLGDKGGSDFEYRAPNETAWRTFQVGQQYDVQINRLEQVQWDTLKRKAS